MFMFYQDFLELFYNANMKTCRLFWFQVPLTEQVNGTLQVTCQRQSAKRGLYTCSLYCMILLSDLIHKPENTESNGN